MSIEIPSLPEDMPGAELKYVGKDVKRIEDPGLVTGAVEFIDNLHLPNMAHCAMLRSPHPHARITSYDTSAAEALPGVVAVITGEDVKRWANPVTTAPEGWGAYCLAVDKVRCVGEPVVAVAAASHGGPQVGTWQAGALRAARWLDREAGPAARTWSGLIRAAVGKQRGQIEYAMGQLKIAEGGAKAAQLGLRRAAIQWRMGELSGDAALQEGAQEWFVRRGVKDPRRFVRMLAPGF